VSAALALAASIPIGYVFALRAGAVAFPLLTLALWRDFSVRALGLGAAGLLGVVIPVIYLITSPNNRGGYNFAYSVELIWAHWIGVAVIVLLALASGKLMRAARARSPSPVPGLPVDERKQHPARRVEQEVVRG
jgi:hypothetical protein